RGDVGIDFFNFQLGQVQVIFGVKAGIDTALADEADLFADGDSVGIVSAKRIGKVCWCNADGILQSSLGATHFSLDLSIGQGGQIWVSFGVVTNFKTFVLQSNDL